MTQTIPTTGDAVALFQTMMQATWYGRVADPDTPPMMGATLEMQDGEAVIVTDVLVGPKGEPGQNAPMIELHWPAPATPDLLPTNWGPEMKNHGFLVGGLVYVWSGTDWHSAIPGPTGPTGATPNLTFTYETIPMEERTPEVIAAGDQVIPTGTSLNKHIKIRALSPQGPQGEMGPIEDATNYDTTTIKSAGKVLTVLPSGKWGASNFAAKHPRLYTIPEQAFSNFTGMSQRHTILSYTLEPQDFDFIPFVNGHIKAIGVELDADPLTIGVEVRLGDPTSGQQIGRGFGNSSFWSTISPHFSEPGDPTVAVAPGNGVAVVAAGEQAVININLYNDGLLGAYIFNRAGAQASVLTIPAL